MTRPGHDGRAARPVPPADAGPRRRARLLRAWRIARPETLASALACDLRSTVTGLLGGSGSLDDPAAAVGAALDVVYSDAGLSSGRADLALSVVVLHALRGDATAPLVLTLALRRLSQVSPGLRRPRALAVRWAEWDPLRAPFRSTPS